MVKIDADIATAATLCLEKHVPFCLYAFPGADAEVTFFSNPSGVLQDDSWFVVGKWNHPASEAIIISKELDAESTAALLQEFEDMGMPDIRPWNISTSHDDYLPMVTELIETINREGLGKVVLSKTLARKRNNKPADIVTIAKEVFSAFPNSFRSLYFSFETGAWLGATPELLVDYDVEKRTLKTMALAGTRPAQKFAPEDLWNPKDIEEQAIVADYICERLSAIGFDVKREGTRTLQTGDLQHICTDISATFPVFPAPVMDVVLDALSPTPAICGFPKERASKLIEETERHPRHCYGGYVGVVDDTRMRMYVNLRCVHFDEETLCIYSGGGILPQSEPEAEWLEAARKASVIDRFFD